MRKRRKQYGAEKLIAKPNRYLTDGKAHVILEEAGAPLLTVHGFGHGKGIYYIGKRKEGDFYRKAGERFIDMD